MKSQPLVASLLFLLFILFLAPPSAQAETPLLHFPDVSRSSVVFVAGGDIWKAPLTGGEAVRLTMHNGNESMPKFSPDGKWIAFTGEYDGNPDVYVMDTHGGHIKRLTFHPGYDLVVGWNSQNNKIIFRSGRDSYSRFTRLYMIRPDGTGLERLILHEAAQGSFSPDGTQIAYNRVSRENRSWKRYQGGTAQEVYIYNFKTQTDTNITRFRGTDRIPMWMGSHIYFSSDRDRVLNIYAYDVASATIDQITRHTRYDVRFPSMGHGKIVYELGGDLWLLDPLSKETHKIPITINSDLPELRPYYKKVKDYVTAASVSPTGKRILVEARGEIFSLPQKEGPIRNLTETPGAREKDAVWSPDGTRIAYFSDQSGEYQIYVRTPGENGKAVQVTRLKPGYRHTLRWSPDSKKLAFGDEHLQLNILDLNTGNVTVADKAEYQNIDITLDKKAIYDFNWSPDSRFIAYSKMDSTLVNKIYIYSLEQHKTYCVSQGLFNDFQPVFSADGAHLFFISNRRFEPTYGDMEWEMVYKNIAGIYAFTLAKNGAPLFPLTDDEEGNKPKDSKKKSKIVRVRIDFEGLQNRVEALPVKRGNYRSLSVNETTLFYLNKATGDFNRFEFRSHFPMDLFAFSFKEQKETPVLKKIDAYRLSANGKQMVYRRGHQVGMLASDKRDAAHQFIALDDLTMEMDPLQEWRQIFNEAWRMERDFYYEPGMHGMDWPAMKEKYGRLLERAASRQDLRFLIGELIGELNTSHTYIYGGDVQRRAERVNVGLLGADYETDPRNHLYKFKKIYRIPDWLNDGTAPLNGPGKHIQPGDYLLQVNGQAVTTAHNIYSYFTGLSGKEVSLLVNSKPTLKGARKLLVKPIGSEYRLRYLDWLEHNRKVVETASNGQIGYLHLPDTFNGSARIFPKYYYSQTTKKGLIVDGRYNGGGLDPDIFLQRLDKKPVSFWARRYTNDYFSPWLGNRAHLVCLTNRQAGSGGDELPYLFRLKGMGKVIGTRSWGGLVGYSTDARLIDGGVITMPDYRIYNAQGKWVVENEGVTPDIEIDMEPAEMDRGYDAQLMKGVEELLKEIKADPRPWPRHQPYPKDR